MNEKYERALRRKASRLQLQGLSLREIGRRVRRSVGWVSKWLRRVERLGSAGLHSQSRRPRRSAHRYPAHVRRVVARVRRRLEKRTVGRLMGASAIAREIRLERLLPKRQRPSRSTIKRILHEADLIRPPRAAREVYYPPLLNTARYVLQLMDWTSRYLEGGAKVYAFHSIDVETRMISQTISDTKRGVVARAHALNTWKTLGLPDFCQIDNDADWRGTLKQPRYVSAFMRLALYVGVELLFIPKAEAERNGLVEWLNGLWGKAFWSSQHFCSVRQVQRRSPAFLSWYSHHYEPFRQHPHTPAQAHRRVARRRLTAREIRSIPNRLPITAGRIHFMRRVDEQGDIHVLHETWHVTKRLAGHYVLASILTPERRLLIHYRRSHRHAVRRLKTYRYVFAEPVVPLRPEFRRPYRRRKLFTML